MRLHLFRRSLAVTAELRQTRVRHVQLQGLEVGLDLGLRDSVFLRFASHTQSPGKELQTWETVLEWSMCRLVVHVLLQLHQADVARLIGIQIGEEGSYLPYVSLGARQPCDIKKTAEPISLDFGARGHWFQDVR